MKICFDYAFQFGSNWEGGEGRYCSHCSRRKAGASKNAAAAATSEKRPGKSEQFAVFVKWFTGGGCAHSYRETLISSDRMR